MGQLWDVIKINRRGTDIWPITTASGVKAMHDCGSENAVREELGIDEGALEHLLPPAKLFSARCVKCQFSLSHETMFWRDSKNMTELKADIAESEPITGASIGAYHWNPSAQAPVVVLAEWNNSFDSEHIVSMVSNKLQMLVRQRRRPTQAGRIGAVIGLLMVLWNNRLSLYCRRVQRE